MIVSFQTGESIRPAATAAPPNGQARPANQRRWLFRVVLALVAGAAAGAAAWFLWPAPRVTVRTLLHVPPSRPWLLRHAGAVPDLPDHQRTQVALLKSRLVLQAALRDKKVAGLPTVAQHPDPAEWLEKEVQADFSVAPEILRIALSGDKPDDLVVLVNALREAYLREIVERETTQRRERLNTLRELQERTKGQLQASREEQRKLEQAVAAKDAGARSLLLSFLQQQLATVERELIQTRSDLIKAKAQLKVEETRQENLSGLHLAQALVDAEVEGHPGVKQLCQEVNRLEQAITDNLKAAVQGEESPLIQELKDKLKAARGALAARRREVRPEIEQALRKKAQAEPGANIRALQDRIAVLTESAERFDNEAKKLRTTIQEKTKQGRNLDAIREDLGPVEELSKKIASEIVALGVELSAPKREQVLEPAVATHPPGRAGQLTVAVAAGLACALLALACLSLRLRVSVR